MVKIRKLFSLILLVLILLNSAGISTLYAEEGLGEIGDRLGELENSFAFEEKFFLYDDLGLTRGQEVSKEEVEETEKFPAILYTGKNFSEKEFAFEFEGRTIAYESLSISVYSSFKNEFIELDSKRDTGRGVILQAVGKADDYINPGDELIIRVSPKLFGNGSNKIYWITDTQYYTMYPHSEKDVYDKMAQYGVDLYNRGEIAYIIHTGDVVDWPLSDIQYRIADAAQRKIDLAGVPNGILAGNHDVGWNDSYDYYNFQKYFGRDRYSSNPWYGVESTYDNALNYQLITLGDKDFIFVNIGYGIEDDPETVQWARDILSKYSHRTAVVSTHAYLDPNGEYVSERAKGLFEEVVKANPNVLLVLNGHWDAAFRKETQLSDRKVIEILSDYQTLDPERYGGEGYTRTIEFADGSIINRTYSPVTGSNNYYGIDEDNFEMDFSYIESRRGVAGEGAFIPVSELVYQEENEYVPDRVIRHGKLPYMIKDPADDSSIIDNINFHVGERPGELNLSFTSDKNILPTFNLYGKDTSTQFLGSGFYHLDRYQYMIELKDLVPGESYKYNLHGIEGEIKAPSSKDHSKVAVLADTQIDDENSGYKSIISAIKKEDYDVINFLGDMTDNGMDTGSFDLLLNLKETEGIYKNIPISTVQGNHDAPNLFHRIKSPDTGIDKTYSYVSGKRRFVILNSNLFDRVSMNRQGRFLLEESRKAKENGEFLVVNMHKGLYTSGSHIADVDLVSLRKFYAPFFEKAGVDLVISGHDHVMTRSRLNRYGQKDSKGVTYISAGHAGNLKWYDHINYKLSKGEPILPNYEFVDFQSNGSPYHRLPSYVELENIGNRLSIRIYVIDGGEKVLVDEYQLDK